MKPFLILASLSLLGHVSYSQNQFGLKAALGVSSLTSNLNFGRGIKVAWHPLLRQVPLKCLAFQKRQNLALNS